MENPIGELAVQVASGRISPEQGDALARGPKVRAALAPSYIQALSSYALDLAIQRQGRESLILHRLTLAATEELPAGLDPRLRWQVIHTYCQIVSGMVIQAPDGRLFRRAVELGEQAVAESEKAGENGVRGDLLHFLGVLHLDPYTAGRTSISYELQIQVWRHQLVDALGDEYYQVPPEELEMPEPAAALETAERYFRRALELRGGHLAGLTLKALAQTLEWRRFLGAPVGEEEIAPVIREAVEKLDQERDPEIYSGALSILARNGGGAAAGPLFAMPLPEMIESFGLRPALAMVSNLVMAHRDQEPLRSLGLLNESIHRAWEAELDGVLAEQLQLGLILLPQALGRTGDEELKPPLAKRVEEVRKRARRERWEDATLAATLLWIAVRSISWDEEAEGLPLLNEILGMDEGFTSTYWQILAFLRGQIYIGLASNAVGADRAAEAVQSYGLALADLLRLKLDSLCMNLLLRIQDLVDQGSRPVAERAVAVLSLTALPLEERLGSGAIQVLQRLYKRCLVAIAQAGGVNPELVWLLWHTAKGLRLASALRERPRLYPWQDDERGMALLRELTEVERQLPPAKESEEPLLDESLLLLAYARPSERRSGDTLEEQHSNLQHAFDQHLQSALLRDTSELTNWYLSLSSTRQALDERTVLLNYFLGASAQGMLAIYFGIVTRDGLLHLSGGLGDFPDPLSFTMEEGDLKVATHPFALLIQDLRSWIQDEPGPGRAVRPEAQEQLASDRNDYLGPELRQLLSELRKGGKDHLCILPHGPLHFYPFHLMGPEGSPLAADWIVTYLPNLQLLAAMDGGAAPEPWDSASVRLIGLTFEEEDPHGLGALPNVREEIQTIADLLGVEPLLDGAATKPVFREALESARYVHLATHGRHRAVAPAFQTLYLAPDGESDGRMASYEILDLDLSGLSLLTLSACETALGRFDPGDNLRGLPASFFLAGVSTLVGTLWPVYDPASRAFFQALYSELRQGRSKLDAFAAAQRQTRAEFPEYRDWGTFYLMGAWT